MKHPRTMLAYRRSSLVALAFLMALIAVAIPRAHANRPDCQIRRISPGAITPFMGGDLYSDDGSGQTEEASVLRGKTAVFAVRILNNADVADSFALTLAVENEIATRVRVFDGTRNITDQVKAGTFAINNLAPGKSRTFKVKAIVDRQAAYESRHTVSVTAASAGDPLLLDTVTGAVTVRYPPPGKVDLDSVMITSGNVFIHFSVTLGAEKRQSRSRSTLTETTLRRDGRGRPIAMNGTLVYDYIAFPSDTFRMSAIIRYRANGTAYGTITVRGSTLRPNPQTRSF